MRGEELVGEARDPEGDRLVVPARLWHQKVLQIKIGPVTFDHADYDADLDVLYLHVGEPQEAEGEETPEGHVLRYSPGSQDVIGLTVLGARRLLDRDGTLTVTIPEAIQTSADDLAPALAAI